MSKNAKVKSIVIQIGEVELSLKPDEAHELMNVLKELLEPEALEPERTYIPYPYPIHTRPYITGPYWTYTARQSTGGDIFCSIKANSSITE